MGKLGDPIVANRILAEGKADFIALARPLLADPYWPEKAKEGRADEINSCICCNNCVDRLFSKTREAKRLFCTVNPSLFREKEYAIEKVAKTKKVMVIGGGLAGMQAAKTAAQRGHQVRLYESKANLGGAWAIGALQPHKELYGKFLEQLVKQLESSGAVVSFNTTVDADFVRNEKPDAVILATGSTPIAPDIRGIDNANCVQSVDVITRKVDVGNRVVVIGGRMIGMEVALYLADQEKDVSLITLKRLGENGRPLEENIYRTLRDRMISRGVKIYPGTPAFEIRPDGVFANDGGNMLWLPADTVALAVGYKPENGLFAELKHIVPEIYSIGDCNAPRDGLEATREGMEAGMKV